MSNNILEPKFFACTQSTELAEKIAKAYGTDLGNVIISKYSDGEFQPALEESVRGRRIFVIGSTFPNSDNLMEMLLILDAAKRASARHITAVIPYFGWARQDRKDKPRVPIAAKLIAKMLETAGATRIITMDLHADQIQGFFEKPVDHLFASTIFMPYLKSLNLENLTIASPDMGGSKRAYAYSKHLKSEVVICYKQRLKANVIAHMELIGDVQGKNVVLVELDFPRRFQVPEHIKQQNAGLQQAFKVTGYPTIWVFNMGKDDKGQYTIDALGKTGYVRGVANFTGGVDDMIKKGKSGN